MRLINEALSINKKDSALYYYQGLTYIAMNNYAAATAPLYKALELDKNNVIAYFYLGLAFDNLSEIFTEPLLSAEIISYQIIRNL